MKVQLIVVQGKPEGKTIPLLGPRFKIGRGETCNLRPGSELVSREHAEFVVGTDTVTVKDLGSRNGTLLNGKALTEEAALKDGDLVTVGNLTFSVSIQGAPAPAAAKTPAAPAAPAAAAAPKTGNVDDVSDDDLDSWLVSDNAPAPAAGAGGVYGGDTITISAFKDAAKNEPAAEETDEGYERLSGEKEEEESDGLDDDDSDDDEATADDMPAEFIDESNPFYVKKKTDAAPESGPKKQVWNDTSDAAKDILSKLLEKRRQSK